MLLAVPAAVFFFISFKMAVIANFIKLPYKRLLLQTWAHEVSDRRLHSGFNSVIHALK